MQIRCLHARGPLVATVLSCRKALTVVKPFQQLPSILHQNSTFRVPAHSQITVLKLQTTCRHNTQQTKRPFSATQTASSMSETEASTSDRDDASLHGLVIFTTLGCAFCRKTKAALNQAGVPYEEVDLSRQLEVLRRLKETTGQTTVPQVFVDGRLVGGADKTLELLGSGKLQQLIRDAKQPVLPSELRALIQERQTTQQESLESLVLPQGMASEQYQLLRKVAQEMQSSRIGELNWAHWTPHNQTFSPEKALHWLESKGHAQDSMAASAFLDGMLDAHLIDVVEDGHLLRLVADGPKPAKGVPLNAGFKWRGAARPASQVAEVLRQIILGLYDSHLAADGRTLDYSALTKDPGFPLFVTATAELQAVDPGPLDRDQRIAFFLNTYNVLIVHAQAVLSGPSGLLERLRWFSSIKYNIGGQDYSADDIEHGILRGNRPASASLPVLLGHPEWSSGHFKRGDPRLKQVVRNMDKRIHFALNCGAKSCPPIKVYTPETLEEGLQSAAAAFCEGEVAVDVADRTVTLSKVFQWYGMDFGSKKELLTWLVDYLSETSSRDLKTLLEKGDVGSIKLSFKDYDWSLNSS